MKTPNQSVMQRALGADWDQLHSVIQAHYSIGTDNKYDRISFQGFMETISVTGMGKLMAWCARPLHALLPYSGIRIRTEIYNWTKSHSGTIYWRRLFHYPECKPVVFQSRMEYYRDKEIIEYVRGGLGLVLHLSVRNGALIFDGQHYVLTVAGCSVRLPNWLMAGKAFIQESQVGENQVSVDFYITHPVWGQTFAYSGTFDAILNGVSCNESVQ